MIRTIFIPTFGHTTLVRHLGNLTKYFVSNCLTKVAKIYLMIIWDILKNITSLRKTDAATLVDPGSGIPVFNLIKAL